MCPRWCVTAPVDPCPRSFCVEYSPQKIRLLISFPNLGKHNRNHYSEKGLEFILKTLGPLAIVVGGQDTFTSLAENVVTFVTQTKMCTTCVMQTGKRNWYFSHSTSIFHFCYSGIICVNKKWWKISLKQDEGFFRISNMSCPSEASVISPVSWAGSFNFLCLCNWLEIVEQV